MDLTTLRQLASGALERARPAAPLDDARLLLAAALAGALLVAVPPLWRRLRIIVTLVHELGHAGVGLLAGRRFTGFQIRGDMSGHAVTVGPARGFGRIATTWAGYPAPAIVGAGLLIAGARGWGPTLLALCLLVLTGSLLFARSLGTVLGVLATLAAVGAVWWFAGALGSALLAIAAGALLLLGAWRHLGTVITSARGQDDPQVLARLTSLPAWVWNASFALVLGLATAAVLRVFGVL